MELLSDITALKSNIKKLQEADKAYEESEPIMSDAEYDELKLATAESVENIDKSKLSKEDYAVILDSVLYLNSMRNTLIGKDLEYDQVKQHLWELSGVSTVYTVTEFLTYMYNEKKDNADGLEYYYLEPKYDGISLSLGYKDNELQSALTRGNGIQGEDILSLVKGIDSIPDKVTWKGEIQVNGELVISLENFKKINTNSKKQYKTPRSALVACINSEDRFRLRTYAEFMPYSRRTSLENKEKKIPDLLINKFKEQKISTWGREDIKSKISDIQHYFKTIEEVSQCSAYPIDGVVITCTQTLRSIAIKPKKVGKATTIVRDVKWNITGKDRKLTCSLIVEPVYNEGKEYSRLPLRDLQLLNTGEIQMNQAIEVCIENGVLKYSQRAIGEADEEVTRIDRPSLCPRCSEPLVEKERNYYCLGNKCKSFLVESFLKLNKVLQITVARPTLELMIDSGADNLYKYLTQLIEGTPLAKEAFLTTDPGSLLVAFNIPTYKDADYGTLFRVLTEVQERCNVLRLQVKVHKLNIPADEVQSFKRKMHFYYEFCKNNVDWIEDFFALIKKHKGW